MQVSYLIELCQKDFWFFCKYMNADFFNTRPELEQIADKLTSVYEKGGRLAISTPPRTGKSTLINHYIAWTLLKNKDNSIIRASYSQSLSSDLNQQVRQLLEEERFLILNDLEIEINTQTKIKLKGSHRSNIYATSVGGSITGFGANIIIADDLYKDHNEALSDTINNKTINWFFSAFSSRLDSDKQIEIIIGTRWRKGELVEVLEESNYFDNIVKVKALQNGKSFNENVIKTKRLLELQKIQHPSIFNSMYQQESMEALDKLFEIKDFVFLDNYEEYANKKRLMIFDLANEGVDYTSGVVADVYKDNIVIIDLFTNDKKLKDNELDIINFANAYDPDVFLVEENSETFFAKMLSSKLRKLDINASTFRTTKNKRTKILHYSGYIQNFKFLKTTDKEYNYFIKKVCRYDLSNKNNKDDEVDVLAMLAEFAIKGGYYDWKLENI